MSVRLMLGDCLDRMAEIEDGSIDAIITDPPYCAGAISEAQRTRTVGQGLRSETTRRFGWFIGDNMGTAGLTWLLREVAVESTRIVKPTGSLLLFCDWRMQATIQPAIESAGLRYQGLVVWDKQYMGLGTGFRCQHELVLHFSFGSPAYYDRGTSNVIRCKRVSRSEREHQTQKPVDLLTRLIKVVSPPDGMILDPFLGSGTTGVACMNSGRSFVGIERDESYFRIAEKRIEEAQAAMLLLQGQS